MNPDWVGGQAGAPADDDHGPLVTSPRRGHRDAVTRLVTSRGRPKSGRPVSRGRNGLTSGSGPRGRWEGQGRAEGLIKFGQLFDVPICGHESLESTEDRGQFRNLNELRADFRGTSYKIADDNNVIKQ